MAKSKAKDQKAKTQHWWNYTAQAYQVTAKSYPWLPWALLGVTVLGILIGVLPALTGGSWIFSVIFAILLGAMAPMVTLGWLTRSATYKQLEGMPGAAFAVLDGIKRGWNIESEPVRINPRTQEMVYRAIGRPGVVLVGEGEKSRVSRLVNDERQAVKHVAPNAPVHVLFVGTGTNEVRLSKLEKTMRKLPKAISHQEVDALTRRLAAIQKNRFNIPRGMDPTKPQRMNRRALRGN
ncbi:MAG: DUF4191 domain-containing protein [Actinomycetaceae bacterium]|nr:DUF4191 domain-containing protein [Actinomycetaceae bacterium]MDY6083068.1 DUF4191 domain-containing protein [Actinomycetaceae bacterium]